MKTRFHAAKIISKRMLIELFIHPWYYIFFSIGLLSGFSVIMMFINSIGSSGVTEIILGKLHNPYIELLMNSFGLTFLTKLFRQGPFFFALCYSSYPLFIYLSMSTVFKFGYEKNLGAIELVVYGPADGTSYVLASLIKNIIATFIFLMVLFIFFFLGALLNNLVLGSTFFYAIFLLFFFLIALYCYAVFALSISNGAGSALAISIFLYILFFSIQIGAFQIVQIDVRYYSTIISRVVQWISPVYYWYKSLEAVEYGNLTGYFLNLLFLVLLSGLLLTASHIILKKRGVRG